MELGQPLAKEMRGQLVCEVYTFYDTLHIACRALYYDWHDVRMLGKQNGIMLHKSF